MNERIRLLWEEAAKTTPGDSWEEQTKFLERFAELIVRECAKVAGQEQVYNERHEIPVDIEQSVLEHFGVKK